MKSKMIGRIPMESYLGIIHLAVGIGAIVPIIWPGGQEKMKVLWIFALSVVVLLALYRAFEQLTRRRVIAVVRRDIICVLKENESMTFEQIVDSCYYRDVSIANCALAELVEHGLVGQTKKRVEGTDGRIYVVRV